MPPDIPDTIPVLPTVAIPVLPELQLPPLTELLSVEVDPTQTTALPERVPAVVPVLTVTIKVAVAVPQLFVTL